MSPNMSRLAVIRFGEQGQQINANLVDALV